MAEYYESVFDGADIDNEVMYIKNVARKKISEHNAKIGELEDKKADEDSVVKYSEKNQPNGYLGLNEAGQIDQSFLNDVAINGSSVDTEKERELSNLLYANALKGTASGSDISLNDVSPVEHAVIVQVDFPDNIDATSMVITINGEPYTPDVNGVLEVISTSPTMTFLCETDGVTMEVQYNRDVNIAYQELAEAIIAVYDTLASF